MKVVLEKTIYDRAAALFDEAAGKYGLEWCLIEPLEADKALAFHREGARTFIIGTRKYPADFYSALEPETLVQRFGVGYTSVPVELCRERGIHVGYTPGVLEAAVAEHTMALILALSRSLCTLDRGMKAGKWNKMEGTELRGKTLALVGFGRIACEVAFIARNGFRMRIAAYDVRPKPDAAAGALADEYFTDLDACLASADHVSLHLPDTPQTAGMVDADFLSRMNPSAFLINTARGGLIDDPALFDALKTGIIAGAALDVFAREPYEPSGPDFRTLDNVILTPHCASNTVEANARMAEICIANCTALAAGSPDELVLIP